jgi:hypothetical protein
MASSRNQSAVAGLVATVHEKLNGVSTSAATPATAERLIDNAVSPPPK